jgi:DNA-binding NtrC family response regulator
MLWQELREPILTWRPGQWLELPPPGRASTLVLHDVSELSYDDQHRLLCWLDETAGRIRVVSTTAVPLWPRVKREAFNEVLYYRLNTVCVEAGI